MGILFILSLFGWAFFIMYFLPDLKAGASLFSAYVAMALLMTLFGLYAGWMRWAAYILIYGGILAFLMLPFLFIYTGDRKRWRAWLEPSSVFVLLSAIGLFLISRGLQPTIHDEFSHWAKVVKVMYLFDTGYLRPFSTLTHADYPPALSVLQYAAVRAFGWREGTLYLVNGLSIIVSFAYLIEDIAWKKVGQALLFLGLAMGFYAIPNRTFSFTSLLIDGPMAIIFVVALIKAVALDTDKKREFLPVLLASLLLPLMKNPSGMLFALSAACCMAFRVHIPQRDAMARKVMKRAFAVVICLLIVVASYESWNVYYNLNNYQTSDRPANAPAFSLTMLRGTGEVNQGADALFGPITAEKEQIIQTAVQSIVKDKFPSARIGGITILLMVLLSIALFVAAYLLLQRDSRKKVLLLAGVLLAVSICYALGTYAAYVSRMKEVTEIFRYSGVILIPLLVAPTYFITRLQELKWKRRIQLSLVVAVAVFFGLCFAWKTWPLAFLPSPGKTSLMQRNANQYLSQIRGAIVPKDHVLFISPFEESTTLDVYSMQYYLLPTYSYLTSSQAMTAEKLAELVAEKEITVVVTPLQQKDTILPQLSGLSWVSQGDLAVYRINR